MARYKLVDRSPRFLPIVLEAQLLPGSFEYALDYLIDTELDLSGVAQGKHTVASVLPGSQYRKAGASWLPDMK